MARLARHAVVARQPVTAPLAPRHSLRSCLVARLTFSAAIFLAVTSLLFSFNSARKLASPPREYRQCRNCDDSWYGDGPAAPAPPGGGVASALGAALAPFDTAMG